MPRAEVISDTMHILPTNNRRSDNKLRDNNKLKSTGHSLYLQQETAYYRAGVITIQMPRR